MIQRTACLIAHSRDACRNLAIEKHLMDTLPDSTALLYLWQNQRAIASGRQQDPWSECQVGAFLSSGGQIVRRLSGGGAWYQDAGCLNFSFIVPKTAFDISRQLSIVGMTLGAFGVQAASGPHGELRVTDRCCCTNAYFKNGAAALHHGTLLVEADFAAMDQYLAPEGSQSAQKINLSSLSPAITMDALQEALYWAFARAYGSQPVLLDERMLDAHSVDSLTEQFADSRWNFPRSETFTHSFSERFPWGCLTVRMRIEGGVIRSARLYSDAMEAGLFMQIEQALSGAPCLISGLLARIDQRLAPLRDPHLLQMAEDVKNLMRQQLRGR